jgi:hypothetical protein
MDHLEFDREEFSEKRGIASRKLQVMINVHSLLLSSSFGCVFGLAFAIDWKDPYGSYRSPPVSMLHCTLLRSADALRSFIS